MTLLYQREKRVKSLRSLADKAILEDIISFCGDYVKIAWNSQKLFKKSLAARIPTTTCCSNHADHRITKSEKLWLVNGWSCLESI